MCSEKKKGEVMLSFSWCLLVDVNIGYTTFE